MQSGHPVLLISKHWIIIMCKFLSQNETVLLYFYTILLTHSSSSKCLVAVAISRPIIMCIRSVITGVVIDTICVLLSVTMQLFVCSKKTANVVDSICSDDY